MQNAITTLRIQNFKSIKDVTMQPRRVNIIIGEPNVGKSNILEALSLLGGIFFDKAEGRFMDGQLRYETVRNLFYDNDWAQEITVTGEGVGTTRLRKKEEGVEVIFKNDVIKRHLAAAMRDDVEHGSEYREESNVAVDFERSRQFHKVLKADGQTSLYEADKSLPSFQVKKYAFYKQTSHGKSYYESFLRPPHGDNLLEVIRAAPSAFKKEIGAFFTPFGLNLALRPEELEVQKNVEGVITAIPYALVADTLQRLIFYLAAIESNTDSVLLFEEPEAHSFPQYVLHLAQNIVESSSNQFFIVTHSPYLITEILEEMLLDEELKPELAMFAAYYEDYQTKVNQLTDEDIYNVRRDGLDVFFNMRRFVPETDL